MRGLKHVEEVDQLLAGVLVVGTVRVLVHSKQFGVVVVRQGGDVAKCFFY